MSSIRKIPKLKEIGGIGQNQRMGLVKSFGSVNSYFDVSSLILSMVVRLCFSSFK